MPCAGGRNDNKVMLTIRASNTRLGCGQRQDRSSWDCEAQNMVPPDLHETNPLREALLVGIPCSSNQFDGLQCAGTAAVCHVQGSERADNETST